MTCIVAPLNKAASWEATCYGKIFLRVLPLWRGDNSWCLKVARISFRYGLGAPETRSHFVRAFAEGGSFFVVQDYAAAFFRSCYLEQGLEGWLGPDSYDSLIFHRIHIDPIQHGHQNLVPFSQIRCVP